MTSPLLTLDMMRQALSTALVCDALDAEGMRRQSPRVPLRPLTMEGLLVGRCKTTLWADMAHADPRPYELELRAVDECKPDDVLLAAAGGSMRSGIWGELLGTAAQQRGCAGVLVDGAVRDLRKLRQMKFPVFALGVSPYDSLHRQRVIDINVPVEIDGVIFAPGDLVFADEDGVVVVPQSQEEAVLRRAWDKAQAENLVRDALRAGQGAVDTFRKFGVL